MRGLDKRIRAVLVKDGLVAEDQADKALAAAARDNRSFTEVLVETNCIGERDLLAALALEANVPPIDLDRIRQFDEAALRLLDAETAARCGVVPLSRIDNLVSIAVANPFDVLELDELRQRTGCELRPFVASERAVRAAVARAYRPSRTEIKAFLETVAEPAVEVQAAAPESDELSVRELTEGAADAPVVKLVNLLVAQALQAGASDIHIEPKEKATRIRFRQDGVLHDVLSPPRTMHNAIVSRIKILSGLDIAEHRVPQDGKFQMRVEGRTVDFRVSTLPLVHGEKVVLRILDTSGLSRSLDALGFEPQAREAFRRAIGASHGMLLVTGPTGSGKTTTLYSALQEMQSPEDNIVTVEDPVEYQLDGVNQVPVSAKRGLTFASALRSILRQDPDIVMVGEIRDAETADIAVKAALTGHLVLSTLHTNDAASSITRLVDMGIDPFMVASSVLLVSAQRLLRSLCEQCKRPLDTPLPAERLAEIGLRPEEARGMRLMKAVGCPQCTQGYKGRFAILEALEVDDTIRRMVVEGKSALDLKAYAVQQGMMTLRRTAILHALRGRTSLEEVLRMTQAD